jgi:hypothetical protein
VKALKKIWGTELEYKERMRLPLHRVISIAMLPCNFIQGTLYALSRVCRERRMEKELRNLNNIDQFKIATHPLLSQKLAKYKEEEAGMLDALEVALKKNNTLECMMIVDARRRVLREDNQTYRA